MERIRVQVDIVNRKVKWFWYDSARTTQEFLDIMNDNPNAPKLKYRLSSVAAKSYHGFWNWTGFTEATDEYMRCSWNTVISTRCSLLLPSMNITVASFRNTIS